MVGPELVHPLDSVHVVGVDRKLEVQPCKFAASSNLSMVLRQDAACGVVRVPWNFGEIGDFVVEQMDVVAGLDVGGNLKDEFLIEHRSLLEQD